MVGLMHEARARSVHELEAAAVPGGIGDPVLVPDEGGLAAPRQTHEGGRVERHAARAEIEHIEVARGVLQLVVQQLELHGPADHDLILTRHPVDAVEDGEPVPPGRTGRNRAPSRSLPHCERAGGDPVARATHGPAHAPGHPVAPVAHDASTNPSKNDRHSGSWAS